MSDTVLLTGAFGNLGFHTLNALLSQGKNVVAFDLDNPSNRKKAEKLGETVQICWGDITDKTTLQAALENVDSVIHMAAIIPPFSEIRSDLARRINVDATDTLVKLMEQSENTKRLVFASSIGVFGKLQDREPPLTADSPAHPEDQYGQQKLDAEAKIRQSELQWSILRICPSPPTQIFNTSFANLEPAFQCSADARVEFVHPADVGLAFANAASCDQAIGKLLYLGGGETCRCSHYEFTNSLFRCLGMADLPRSLFKQSAIPEFFGDWVDTEESQRLLKFQRNNMTQLTEEMRSNAGILPYLIKPIGKPAMWILSFFIRRLMAKADG